MKSTPPEMRTTSAMAPKTICLKLALPFAILFGIHAAVPAWDGTYTATISKISVTGGSNYGFRVYLSGVPSMCTNGPDWAYLLDTDSNYKTYVATILLAKAQGTTISINSTYDGQFCHIGYIAAQ